MGDPVRVMDDPDTATAGAAFRGWVERDLVPVLADRRERSDEHRRAVVLLETTSIASAQIAHAFLATALAAEHDATIVAYRFGRRRGLRARIVDALRTTPDGSRQPDPEREVYRPFCDRVLELVPTRSHERRARRMVDDFYASEPDLYALEAYAVDGAVLGDLILDKHVQRGNPVIRVDHPGVRRMLEDMTARALTLHAWFSRHEVIASISSGLAVSPGLPLRVALARGVPAFPTTLDFTWRLTPDRPNWSRDYESHRADFAELDAPAAAAAREQAERFLAESLGADRRGGQHLGSTSAWARRPLPDGLLPEKAAGQRTVLVAAHSFSDSPHSIGNTLFPDFFSWLEHLAELAGRTDYEWLFKLHPDERDRYIGVQAEVERLLERYPNTKLIPSGVSHWALLERGIDLVLTIYGSIAVEYPALGIPAIVAWPDGFISGYSFALRPTSVAEYDRLILDPREWDYPIPRDELLEFVYCHYLRPHRPGVFQRVPAIRRHGEDGGSFKKWPFHRLWADQVTAEDAREVLRVHREWVRSETYSRNAFDR